MIRLTKNIFTPAGIVSILLILITPIQGQESKSNLSAKSDSLQNIVDNQLEGDLSQFDVKTFVSFLDELQQLRENSVQKAYMTRVLEKKDEIGDKLALGDVFNELASSHFQTGTIDSAIVVGIQYKLFLEGLDEDEFNKFEIIHESLGAIKIIAGSFAYQGNLDNAFLYLDEAIALIESIDTEEARKQFSRFEYITTYELKGRFLYNTGRYSEAEALFQKVKERAIVTNNKPMIAYAQLRYAQSLSKREGIHGSLVIDELNKVNRQDFQKITGIRNLYNRYAGTYSALNMVDSARRYADKALTSALLGNDYSIIESQYDVNTRIAKSLKDWEWAMANSEGQIAYFTQIQRKTSQRNVGALESKLENERVQAGLNASLIAQKDRKMMIAGGALFLLIINIVLFRYFRLAKRAKKLQLTENDNLRASKELAELKKEKLESLLDYKRRQLTTTVMTTSRLNSQMTLISEKLKEIIGNQQDAPRLMDRLLREINSNVQSQDDWAQFYKHFESVHPNFFSQLQKVNTELSNNELRHAAYVLMGLSNKEVASMHNITPDSAKTARIRLKKRLNLVREDSLQSFINNLIDQPSRVLKQA